MNAIDPAYTPKTNFTGVKLQAKNNLMEQARLTAQTTGTPEQKPNYDTVEISDAGIYAMAIPKEVAAYYESMEIEKVDIKVEPITNKHSIAGLTLISSLENLQASFEKADRMSLSFGERLKFLHDEGVAWVKDKQVNNPAMYVQWVRTSKDHIENGKPELACLPKDFTMDDYYKVVGK